MSNTDPPKGCLGWAFLLFCAAIALLFFVFKTAFEKDYDAFKSALCASYSIKFYCVKPPPHLPEIQPIPETKTPSPPAEPKKTTTAEPSPPALPPPHSPSLAAPPTTEEREFSIYEGQPSDACRTSVVARSWKGEAGKVNFVFNGKSEDVAFNQPLRMSPSCVLTPLYAQPFAGQIQIHVREISTK
jgi:hypothetical protein